MKQEQLREKIHAGIDRHCAPLTADPCRVQRVLHAARQEGGGAVKKKVSVTFALVLATALVSVTAFAVVSMREAGRLFAQTEQAMGEYMDWPSEKKAAVICVLMDEGCIEETPERKLLRGGTLAEKVAARIADEALAEFTGEDAQHASFLSLMSVAWGPFEQWSQEQKAWYSQVLADAGASMDGNTRYVEEVRKLSAEEAEAIAKREIARGFGVDDSLIDKYRVYEVSLQIPEFAAPGDTKAYWYVAMDTELTELAGQEGLPFRSIDVFVDPDTGELLEPIEEKVVALQAEEAGLSHPLAVTIRDFEAAIGETKAFHTWTLEHKARWSQEIAPQIRAYLAADGDVGHLALGDMLALAVDYTYALPDEQTIPQEQALAVAREALAAAYSLSDEELSLLTDNGLSFDAPAWFYDVTNPAQPLWKVIFTMPSIYCADDAVAARVKALYGTATGHNQYYMVEINANTGTVIRTLAAQSWPDMLKAF